MDRLGRPRRSVAIGRIPPRAFDDGGPYAGWLVIEYRRRRALRITSWYDAGLPWGLGGGWPFLALGVTWSAAALVLCRPNHDNGAALEFTVGVALRTHHDDVTRMLAAAGRGESRAAERLFPIVYDELRAVAGRYLRRQRPDHTLQATALVHEAYLRLVGRDGASWRDRDHFCATAAVAMRHILVNHARRQRSLRRGGGRAALTIDTAEPRAEERPVDLVALDEALTGLADLDPRQARIVELRFFGALSTEETARVMDVSVRTVHREWTTARLWLRAAIEEGRDGDC